MIILSFILCCCGENLRKETVKGKPLPDGSETYYIIEKNDKDLTVHSTRFDENDEIIEEYEYSYSYDISGKLTVIKKINVRTGSREETVYDKYKNKTEEIFYNSDGIVTGRKEYLKNGNVKKTYIYKNGKETGYTLFDYYTDNQLKSETVYSISGKTVKITTYYKNRQLYQIKDFDKSGMVEKITKYFYKGDNLVKISLYDGEFNLYQSTDFSTDPPKITKYENGTEINNG